MSSIFFLVPGRKGRSTCDDVGRGASVVASVSIEGTDSMIVVVGCVETAPVLRLSTMVARERWDISNPIRGTGKWLDEGVAQFARN